MWEEESELVLKDTKVRRTIAYVSLYILLFVAEVIILLAEQIPIHRGSLSTAEFCENYNKLADYYEIETGESLDKTGKWISKDESQTTAYITFFTESPDFIIIEENGEVVEVSFCLEDTNSTEYVSNYSNYMVLAALSYMGAQEDIAFFSNDRNEIAECIDAHSFENFEMIKADIKMTCNVTYTGYQNAGLLLIPNEGEDNYYRMEFKLEKIK